MVMFSKPLIVAAALYCSTHCINAQPQQQAPQQPLPDAFPAALRDEWFDMMSIEPSYTKEACAKRHTLLKGLNLVTDKEVIRFRVMLIQDIGYCYLSDEVQDYKQAAMRFGSALGEVESMFGGQVRDESQFLKVPQLQGYAPLVFAKQAALALQKENYSDAAMSLRRANIITEKNLDKEIRMVAKHNKLATSEELKTQFEQVKIRIMPELQKHKEFRQQYERMGIASGIVKKINQSVVYNSQRQRGISENKFVPGVLYKDTVWTSGHPILNDLMMELSEKWPKTLPDQKQITIISPTKASKGAKDKAGLCDSSVWPEFCEIFSKKSYYADFASNIFGGVKIVKAKQKEQDEMKPIKLETAESNAVIGVLFPKEEITIKYPVTNVGITPLPESTHVLEANTPYMINFARPVEIVEHKSPVLFVQLWHPELAPIERTTFIRTHLKSGDKDHVNLLAKLVNDAADQWEKTKKLWQKESFDVNVDASQNIHYSMSKSDLESDVVKKQKLDQLKKQEALNNESEEQRQQGLEKLEKQRQEEEKKRKEIAEKRRIQAEKRANEQKEMQPWLETTIKMKPRKPRNSEEESAALSDKKIETTMAKEQEYLEELKGEKRGYDIALEFGLGQEVLPLINAQERRVASAEKLAMKAYEKEKKGGKKKESESKVKKEEPKKKESKSKSEKKEESSTKPTKLKETPSESLKELEAKLTKLNKERKELAMKDDFAGAKKLKKEAKTVEEKIAKLKSNSVSEAKSEL